MSEETKTCEEIETQLFGPREEDNRRKEQICLDLLYAQECIEEIQGEIEEFYDDYKEAILDRISDFIDDYWAKSGAIGKEER